MSGLARRKVPAPELRELSPAQSIGLFFRKSRQSQDLSQEQLATLTRGLPGRVSRAMISAIERGVHLPGLEVLLTLSQALHISPNEVLERLELSRLDGIDTVGLTYEHAEQMASKAFWAGQHRRAVAFYDAMLRLLADDPHEDADVQRRRQATIELRRGAALRRCGAATAARSAVERAITLSDDMPDVQAQAYVVLAALLVQLGCLPLARDAADRAVQLSEGAELKVQGWAWIEKGEVLAASKQYAEARKAFLEARRRVRECGDHPHEVTVEGNIGECLRGLGRDDQARVRFVKAVELARRYGARASEAHWLVELARLAYDEDRLDQAETYARAAVSIANELKHQLTCFRGEWLKHRIQLKRDPADPDRHRVAYLKRLFTRLEEHRGVTEVREFKQAYGSSSSRTGKAS